MEPDARLATPPGFQSDSQAVANLVLAERLARDIQDWVTMRASYHPDSHVDVSWFRGSGSAFVDASIENAKQGQINFHVMSPPTVAVNGSRAIAEALCTLRSFGDYDGVEVSYEGFLRVLWRVVKDETWLIHSLRCIYVRDMLHACDPSRPPRLDAKAIDSYRPSYRYLSDYLTRCGLTPRDDLPGEDRPATVAALRAAERNWLAGH